MKNIADKKWEHVAGGCLLNTAKKYPCDDTYINKITKKETTIYSTLEAHSKMPRYVKTMSQLLRMEGVSKKDK